MIKIRVRPDPEQIKTNPREVYTDTGMFIGYIREENKRFYIWPYSQKGWMGNRFRSRKTALDMMRIHAGL